MPVDKTPYLDDRGDLYLPTGSVVRDKTDGKLYIIGDLNRNLGGCDCCGLFSDNAEIISVPE